MTATRIKHCGITSLDDAHRAAEAGAWALGMILWPGSPRCCELAEAQLVGAALRRTVQLAGVFVNQRLEEIDQAVETAGLSLVQLHGDEGPAFCGEVGRRTGAKVIKAVRVRDLGDVSGLEPFHTDFHLLDGGGGESFGWEMVRALPRGGPPLILAGGLTPANVGEAIATVRPWAVDVASGTESSPGVKDPELVRALHAAVEEAAPDPVAEENESEVTA